MCLTLLYCVSNVFNGKTCTCEKYSCGVFEHELNVWLSQVCLCSTCLVCNKHLIARVSTINPHGNKEDTCCIITFYSYRIYGCTCIPTHMCKKSFISQNYVAIIHYVVSYIVTYVPLDSDSISLFLLLFLLVCSKVDSASLALSLLLLLCFTEIEINS